jgi:hypothetical protein
MESETVLLMRDRVAELERQISELRTELRAREFELHQAQAALTLMIGIKPSGSQASMGAVAHFTRQKNPETAKLTIKELALKALNEHMSNGATSKQLIDVFVQKWGRDDIARTSLSPQLTRLKEEGMISRQGICGSLRQAISATLTGIGKRCLKPRRKPKLTTRMGSRSPQTPTKRQLRQTAVVLKSTTFEPSPARATDPRRFSSRGQEYL